MKFYKVKIISVLRKNPLPKYKEFDFTLEVYGNIDEKAIQYKTTLALKYSDDDLNSDKTKFVKINSETGEENTKSLETLTLARKDCRVYPPIDYEDFEIDKWEGAVGELKTNIEFDKI